MKFTRSTSRREIPAKSIALVLAALRCGLHLPAKQMKLEPKR